MALSLKKLRRDAKGLKKAAALGDAAAIARTQNVLGGKTPIRHADALHVLAVENGYASWPRLKFSAEMQDMDRPARAERLKMALFLGQHRIVEMLLENDPGLGRASIGLACALYDVGFLAEQIEKDRAVATRIDGIRSPILHLAFSRHLHGGGSPDDMMALANLLVQAGADVNDSYAPEPGNPHGLSGLYGAMGHANNMVLSRWLLENGADPNDNESLYHSTELGHHEGLRMLLDFGAKPARTNALARAADFNDHIAIGMLLDAGADPNEWTDSHPSEEPPFVIPGLHQAARRMCDREVARLLLDAGADPALLFQGRSAYAYARIYGNTPVAEEILRSGGSEDLSPLDVFLASVADDSLPADAQISPEMVNTLDTEAAGLLGNLVTQKDTLPHARRLVAAGLPS